MKLKKYILSTVGTSLFTNFMYNPEVKAYWGDKYQPIHRLYEEMNALTGNVSHPNELELMEIIWEQWFPLSVHDGLWQMDSQKGKASNLQCCAEVQTLYHYLQSETETCSLSFLCSDTRSSWIAGQLICQFLKQYFSNQKHIEVVPKAEVIHNLQVQDFKLFRERGISNLMHSLRRQKQVAELQSPRNQLILNVTGGYKGVIPIMTTIAQLFGAEILYMYERNSDIVQLSPIPLQFDFQRLHRFKGKINAAMRGQLPHDDNQITEEMDQLGLLIPRRDDPQLFELSTLGHILQEALSEEKIRRKENRAPTNEVPPHSEHGNPMLRGSVGTLLDLLVFKHYAENPYSNRNFQQHFITGNKGFREYFNLPNPNNQDNEIDLIFEDQTQQRFIIAEIKPYKSLLANKEQLQKHLQLFAEHLPQNQLVEYHVCVYLEVPVSKYLESIHKMDADFAESYQTLIQAAYDRIKHSKLHETARSLKLNTQIRGQILLIPQLKPKDSYNYFQRLNMVGVRPYAFDIFQRL